MAPPTIRFAIKKALEDLSSDDFLKFCDQLRDCGEESDITRRDVEGKNFLDITNLLVSRFTEIKALQVTLDTLRAINCNGEAETLHSKTKACLDTGDPTFPKTLNGKVETKATQEALNYAADQWPLKVVQRRSPRVMAKQPKEVEDEAKTRVLSEGGDPSNDRLVLSRFTIQFEKYKGQTFKWLLENDVGYTVSVVATHQMEREQTSHQDPMMSNKDSLTRYATAYPEVLKKVKAKQRSRSREARKGLVGLGAYHMETLQDLSKSKDLEKISSANAVQRKKLTCKPGSKKEVLLKNDKQRAAVDRKRAAKQKSSAKSVQRKKLTCKPGSKKEVANKNPLKSDKQRAAADRKRAAKQKSSAKSVQRKKLTCKPVSKKEVANKNPLKSDKQRAVADRKRAAKQKRCQSTGSYPKNTKKAKN